MIAEKMRYIKHRMPFKAIVMTFVASFILLGGCSQIKKKPKDTISEIAYNVNKKEDCLVYIEEGNTFEAYLVLTSDYLQMSQRHIFYKINNS